MIALSWVTRRTKRVFYGWWIVLAGFISVSMSSGLFNNGFGFYYKPIQEQFRWSNTTLSGAYSLSRLESGFLGPIEGYLIQRFGPRIVMAVGVIIFGLGFIMLSLVNSVATFYLSFMLLSLGATLGSWTPMTASVNNWFRRNRSKAIGIAMLGLGLGGVLYSPFVARSVDKWGWETTALFSGIIILAIGLPLSRLMRYSPEPYGYLPDGDAPGNTRGAQKKGAKAPKQLTVTEKDFTVKEALRTRAFWLMSIGHSMALVMISALSLHMVPYLESDLGFSRGQAAQVVMLVAGVNMSFQFIGGFLGDRYPKNYLAVATMIGHGTGALLLATADSFGQVLVAAVVHGMAWGVRGPVLTSMRGEYFGRKSFAMIMGFSSVVMMVGQVIGPIFAGFMADHYSYSRALLIISGCAAVGAVLFFFLRSPQPKDTAPSATS